MSPKHLAEKPIFSHWWETGHGKSPYGNIESTFSYGDSKHMASLLHMGIAKLKWLAANPYMETGFKTYGSMFPYWDHKMVIFKSTWEPIPLQETILKLILRGGLFPYGEGSDTNLFQNRICDHLGIDKNSPHGNVFPYGVCQSQNEHGLLLCMRTLWL
jgi:hypothetical protein